MHETREYEYEPEMYSAIPEPARTPFLTYALLCIYAAVFGLATLAGGTEDPDVLLDFGAMFGPYISEGEYWRLFTATFLHSGIMHLGFNGLSLFIFGQMVERWYGHARFALVYVLSGLAGSVSSYLLNSIAIGAGASGAIFGVIGAMAAFFLIQRRAFGKYAQNSLIGVGVIVAVNIFIGVSTPGIDNWAHVGGLVSGFLLGLALSPRYRRDRTFFGYGVIVNTTGSLLLKWWVVPAALAVLIVGVILANDRLPDNPATRYARAEYHYREGNYSRALAELDLAAEMGLAAGFVRVSADVHLLRGKIYAELGDQAVARQELALAIRFGSPQVQEEALQVIRGLSSQ